MKEIKFRAWDTNNKMMLEVTGVSKWDVTHTEVDWSVAKNQEIPLRTVTSLFEVELMQFTGLKDKNGKEIYEGDILTGANEIPMIIEWHFNRFIYRVNGKIQEFNKLDFEAGFFEVIGNIYKNPELLKDTK